LPESSTAFWQQSKTFQIFEEASIACQNGLQLFATFKTS